MYKSVYLKLIYKNQFLLIYSTKMIAQHNMILLFITRPFNTQKDFQVASWMASIGLKWPLRIFTRRVRMPSILANNPCQSRCLLSYTSTLHTLSMAKGGGCNWPSLSVLQYWNIANQYCNTFLGISLLLQYFFKSSIGVLQYCKKLKSCNTAILLENVNFTKVFQNIFEEMLLMYKW